MANYGSNPGEKAYLVGKQIKPGFMTDVREKTVITRLSGIPQATLSKNSGDTIETTRLKTNEVRTDELVGGNDPVVRDSESEQLSYPLKRFGNTYRWLKHVVDTHESPIIKQKMSTAKSDAERSIETLSCDIIRGGSSVIRADGFARNEVTMGVRKGLFSLGTRILERNEAPFFNEMQKSTPQYGSIDIDQCWFAFFDPTLSEEIRRLDGFTKAKEYTSRLTPLPGEIGTINDKIRCISSNFMKPWMGAGGTVDTTLVDGDAISGKANVYPIVIAAKDSFEFGGFGGKNGAEIHVHNPTLSNSDPAANKGFVTWLAWHGGMITQDKWLTRIEVTAKTDSAIAA